MLKLTNTLTGTPETFNPQDNSTVHMYACGPTVYNFVHIGNLRTYVFEDVLRRHLASKWKIRHVMNITDIDDKIINRSIETGVDINTFTAPFTEAFFEDCEKLRIQRPEIVAPATEHIQEMIDLVSALLKDGYAYREGDSIYYRISQFADYGRLSHLDKRELKIGARIDADEYEKEQPRDFVLWKAPKDPKEPRWPAPFGEGRPGWHLECSAMAMKYLGNTLDIHCGAVDLIFPHHENEIAQSEAVTHRPFVRFWIHGEHLLVNGEKMAKSKGNFYTLRDLLEKGYDPLTIRYLLVSVRYRKQLNFTFDGLKEAKAALDRIKEFVFRLTTATNLKPGRNDKIHTAAATARDTFEAALDDDLNTSGALGALFILIGECNIALASGELQEDNRAEILDWMKIVDDRLAIVPPMEHLVLKDDGEVQAIEELIRKRSEAKRNRDFALSDKIRQELTDRGILIEDTREGTRWRRK
ncbi:MAG TPA: cysteine--tRNA ligase [Terriglobia bacterium]|nr:cysteine--tRNA ligase [Terriglobia bacterium]